QHYIVAHETQQWVTKGRGPVAFKNKMPNPGEAVAAHRNDGEQPQRTVNQTHRNQKGGQTGAGDMKFTIDGMLMLAHIVEPKGRKVLDAVGNRLLRGHSKLVHDHFTVRPPRALAPKDCPFRPRVLGCAAV